MCQWNAAMDEFPSGLEERYTKKFDLTPFRDTFAGAGTDIDKLACATKELMESHEYTRSINPQYAFMRQRAHAGLVADLLEMGHLADTSESRAARLLEGIILLSWTNRQAFEFLNCLAWILSLRGSRFPNPVKSWRLELFRRLADEPSFALPATGPVDCLYLVKETHFHKLSLLYLDDVLEKLGVAPQIRRYEVLGRVVREESIDADSVKKSIFRFKHQCTKPGLRASVLVIQLMHELASSPANNSAPGGDAAKAHRGTARCGPIWGDEVVMKAPETFPLVDDIELPGWKHKISSELRQGNFEKAARFGVDLLSERFESWMFPPKCLECRVAAGFAGHVVESLLKPDSYRTTLDEVLHQLNQTVSRGLEGAQRSLASGHSRRHFDAGAKPPASGDHPPLHYSSAPPSLAETRLEAASERTWTARDPTACAPPSNGPSRRCRRCASASWDRRR